MINNSKNKIDFKKWFFSLRKKLKFSIQNSEQEIIEYKKLNEPKPILYVKNLYKKYPGKKAPAINKISFNVYPGEFHAFIGANGAGKTTTIKSIIGAYARWSGTILINGNKNTSEIAKSKLGYIPENARFPEKMHAFKYLVWMARLSGIKSQPAKEFAESKLKELNMWNLRNKSPNSFSSGQKKKILLAQSLIHNPDVLVMDEPAANLDPKARIEFFDKLLELKKQGKAIFVSSHILSEIERYANSATVLDGGNIIFSGKTIDLYKKYSDARYLIECDDNDLMLKYFHDKKIIYSLDDVKNKYIVKFSTKKIKKDFLEAMVKKGNMIQTFNEIGSSLDDIYRKMIKFGSVDTMSEETANSKTKNKKRNKNESLSK